MKAAITFMLTNTSILIILLAQFIISFPIDKCNHYFLMNYCDAEHVPDLNLCSCSKCEDVCNPNIPNTECALRHKEGKCLNYSDGPLLREIQGDDPLVLLPKHSRPSGSLPDEKKEYKKDNDGKPIDQSLIGDNLNEREKGNLKPLNLVKTKNSQSEKESQRNNDKTASAYVSSVSVPKFGMLLILLILCYFK